jgi:hypothetical protein
LSDVLTAGISDGMSRFVLVALAALALGGTACDVRPLTARELYGATAGTGGAAGTAGGAGTGGTAGAAPDGGAGAPPPDAAMTETAPEAPGLGCGAPCPADQFCDDLAGQCAPRGGVGMISGQVYDDCTGKALGALVGIADHHACSYEGKGGYYFSGIPLGKLKLGAAKEGYEVYGAVVDVVQMGTIHDIRLVPEAGCDAPPPAGAACSCPIATCKP